MAIWNFTSQMSTLKLVLSTASSTGWHCNQTKITTEPVWTLCLKGHMPLGVCHSQQQASFKHPSSSSSSCCWPLQQWRRVVGCVVVLGFGHPPTSNDHFVQAHSHRSDEEGLSWWCCKGRRAVMDRVFLARSAGRQLGWLDPLHPHHFHHRNLNCHFNHQGVWYKYQLGWPLHHFHHRNLNCQCHHLNH